MRGKTPFAIVVAVTALGLAGSGTASAETPWGMHVDGLRYQAEAHAYGRHPAAVVSGETAAGISADGLRYQAEARVYLRQAQPGVHTGLAYGLIAAGVLLATAGLLLFVRLRGRLTRSFPATTVGSES